MGHTLQRQIFFLLLSCFMVFPLEQIYMKMLKKGDEGGVVEPFFFILLLLFFLIICSGFDEIFFNFLGSTRQKRKFLIKKTREKKRMFNDLDSMKQNFFYGHLTRFLKPYLSCLLKSIY